MIRTDATPQMPERGWPCRCGRCERVREASRQIMADRQPGQHSIQDFTFAGGQGSRPGRRKRHRTKYEGRT